eukprot:156701-Amphidinium_carterae.1
MFSIRFEGTQKHAKLVKRRYGKLDDDDSSDTPSLRQCANGDSSSSSLTVCHKKHSVNHGFTPGGSTQSTRPAILG